MEFLHQFLFNLRETTILEFIAAITGIGSVWFARRESILVYPVGIISVLLYVYICFNAQLYADSGVNFFYFLMSVYGWYHWTHKKGVIVEREITVNTSKQQILGIALTIVSFFLILGAIWYFKKDDISYISSNIPYLDSFTSAVFLIAMWLMALKRVENWIYWIVGDVVSIPVYIIKGLVFTSFQYLVFLAIAILGYLEWRKRWQQRNLSELH